MEPSSKKITEHFKKSFAVTERAEGRPRALPDNPGLLSEEEGEEAPPPPLRPLSAEPGVRSGVRRSRFDVGGNWSDV